MPDWTQAIRSRLAMLDLRAEREAEILEELSQHLDERYAELRAGGMSDDDARRTAVDDLVNPDTLVPLLQPLRQAHVGETHAPGSSTGSLLADLCADIRYAWRGLLRQPGFALVAILTLALGIGANSAIFALADATLLRPLPLPEPERLMMLWEKTDTDPRDAVSPLNLFDWRSRNKTFDGIAGYIPNVAGMVMSGKDGRAETVPRQWVTAGIFNVLGINPILGRTFTRDDDRAKLNAVVLSESFWKQRFDSDPAIVGQPMRLDGEAYTVLGIVPDSAQLIGRSSMWGLISIEDLEPRARRAHVLAAVGRLKASASIQAAGSDMDTVASGLARDFADSNQGRGIAMASLHEALMGSDLRQTAILLLAVVGIVLLICCVNVANLLLARSTARARDLAIRTALGASRRRIVRQILTESSLLAMFGCAVGLALGAVILRGAPILLPPDLLPGTVTLNFDLRLVGFCVATALLVGLLFGLAPAWQATRTSPAQAMGTETRGGTASGGKLRALLVTAEVAMAVVLLVGAGLLLRTLLAIENEDRGYRTGNALTLLVDPLGDRYPTPESLQQFYDEMEREISTIHGVSQVAWSSTLPLGGEGEESYFDVEGAPPIPESERTSADYQTVSASYFQALEVAMTSGRSFNASDRADSVPVMIVNDAFARKYLAGRDPIGARITLRASPAEDAATVVREIVGVAEPVRMRASEREAAPQMYVPMTQDPNDDMYLVARTGNADAVSFTNPVRSAIANVDKEQLVSIRDMKTLEDVAREATSSYRLRAVLIVTFAALAMLLAMVGVFGILAYTIRQRRRDFGVRMALGASARDVLRLVVRNSVKMVAAGLAVGFVFAALMGRWMNASLYGVEPLDPLTFVGVALLLALAASLSTLAPAWKAAHLHPLDALRE